MVKLFGVVFAALLVCAHVADVQGDAYQRPLSMFRDSDPAWLGYALFGVLLAIGALTIRTALRIQAEFHAAAYLVATGLLAIVAATPSNDSWHTSCALTAMALMFVHYAVLLYRADSIFWLVMHLLTPSLLMMASRLESYGIWQKGMILYFVMATIVHQHSLSQWLPKDNRPRRTRVRIRIGRKQAA